MPRRIVNLKVLIEADDEFDVNDLGVCIIDYPRQTEKDRARGIIPDALYIPRTAQCEIVDYLGIEEEDAGGYGA